MDAILRVPPPTQTPVLPVTAHAFDAVARQGPDHALLEVAQEPVQVALAVLEQQNGIGHDLPGAVVGDVAAALDLDDLDLAGGGEVGQRPASPAQGDDVRVLDQHQRVGHLALLPRHDPLELQRVRGPVAHPAEIDPIRRTHPEGRRFSG